MSCTTLQCAVKGNECQPPTGRSNLHMLCRAALLPEAGYTMPAPGSSLDASLNHIRALPVQEAPAVFGLHPNANINLQLQVCCFVPAAVSLSTVDPFMALLLSAVVSQMRRHSMLCTLTGGFHLDCMARSTISRADVYMLLQESRHLLEGVLSVQPRMVGSTGGTSSDDLVAGLAADIQQALPALMSVEEACIPRNPFAPLPKCGCPCAGMHACVKCQESLPLPCCITRPPRAWVEACCTASSKAGPTYPLKT